MPARVKVHPNGDVQLDQREGIRRSFMYLSTMYSEDTITFTENNVTVRRKHMELPNPLGSDDFDNIGVTVGGTSNTRFWLPAGFYDITVTGTWTFPSPQVTTPRYYWPEIPDLISYGDAVVEGFDPSPHPMNISGTWGPGILWFNQNHYQVDISAANAAADTDGFQVNLLEDESTSPYRSTDVNARLSIVRLDEARDIVH